MALGIIQIYYRYSGTVGIGELVQFIQLKICNKQGRLKNRCRGRGLRFTHSPIKNLLQKRVTHIYLFTN